MGYRFDLFAAGAGARTFLKSFARQSQVIEWLKKNRPIGTRLIKKRGADRAMYRIVEDVLLTRGQAKVIAFY